MEKDTKEAFRALMVEKNEAGFSAGIRNVPRTELADSGVLVRMEYSSLNYKDALAITNSGPVVRSWPMIAGIDGAGTVAESSAPGFRPGDRVLLNGWGAGEKHWGCLAEYASLKADWLLKIPESFSACEAMAIGTAGYTAMLCAIAIERHGVGPHDGPILVTGASGGVGGFAISILSSWGYEVVASTGRLEEEAYLKELGATEVIDRASLSSPGRPLVSERWAAAVDSVGSVTLANVCASLAYNGIVAACGLAQGADFPGSVAPFILRGVTLKGVDSVMAPMAARIEAWDRLAQTLDRKKLNAMTKEIELSEVLDAAQALLEGKVRGRLLVKIGSSG